MPHTHAVAPRKVGRPPKGQEKIDLIECWRLRVKNKLTYQEIADHFGCAESSVIRACQRLAELIPDPASVDAYRGVKAEILEGVEQQLLASLIQPEKLKKASTNNVAYAYQQVANQLRLEKGQTTGNIGVLAKLVIDAHEHLADHPAISGSKDSRKNEEPEKDA